MSLIYKPGVFNEITHSMKVSKISSLEVTHIFNVNICKLSHGNIHFDQCLGFLRIMHDCTEVRNV